MSKDGKVLAAEAGGPEATVNVVKKIVEGLGGGEKKEEVEKVEEKVEEEKPAEENGEKKDEGADAPNGDAKVEEEKKDE